MNGGACLANIYIKDLMQLVDSSCMRNKYDVNAFEALNIKFTIKKRGIAQTLSFESYDRSISIDLDEDGMVVNIEFV